MANGNGSRHVLITALISIVLTGGTAWFAWGRQSVSRADVTEMIKTQDPYLADRQTVQQLKASVDRLTERVQHQGEELARMNAILERVERQIDRRTAVR
jgi:uncharacterized protein HemX